MEQQMYDYRGNPITPKGGSGVGDLPISKKTVPAGSDAIEVRDDDKNLVMRIDKYGLRVLSVTDLEGNPIAGGGSGGSGGGDATIITQSIKLQIPDTVYAVVGTELNIWNDCVSKSIDRGLQSPINYYVEWTCNKGKVTSRGFRFTPAQGDVGRHTCTCYLYDTWGTLLDSKQFHIVVSPKNVSIQKNILFVSDSTGTNTYNNIIANFNDEAHFSGVKPNVYNESTGGWHWGLYASAGVVYQRVQVSGVGALTVGARYIDGNNNIFSILEVNVTNGTGNVLIGKIYIPPYGYNALQIPNGTLTMQGSYAGDTTFSYTDGVNEAGNPFWNTAGDCLDIALYRNNRGIAAKFDMVVFQLGINSSDQINTSGKIEGYIEALYDAFIADNPSCLFVLGCTPQSANDHSAIGVNYGAASQNWGIKYANNEYKIRDLYLTWGKNGVHPNMRVVAEHLSIDRYYGYPRTQEAVSDRDTTDVIDKHTNYVHPVSSGYKQLADHIFGFIVGTFNN